MLNELDVIIRVREVKVDDVKKLLQNNQFKSAIGHTSTSNLLSRMLEIEVPVNRVNIKLTENDKLIVFQLTARLEEGRVLTEEEIASLPFKFYLVELMPQHTLEALYHW